MSVSRPWLRLPLKSHALSCVMPRLARTASGSTLGSRNQVGERKITTFLPRAALPTAASFCRIMRQVSPPRPIGKTANPVGRRRKKSSGRWPMAMSSSELPYTGSSSGVLNARVWSTLPLTLNDMGCAA